MFRKILTTFYCCKNSKIPINAAIISSLKLVTVMRNPLFRIVGLIIFEYTTYEMNEAYIWWCLVATEDWQHIIRHISSVRTAHHLLIILYVYNRMWCTFSYGFSFDTKSACIKNRIFSFIRPPLYKLSTYMKYIYIIYVHLRGYRI